MCQAMHNEILAAAESARPAPFEGSQVLVVYLAAAFVLAIAALTGCAIVVYTEDHVHVSLERSAIQADATVSAQGATQP